jgi:hypothetical protein
MARTATATRPKAADPYQARREIIDRVLARRPSPVTLVTRATPEAGPNGENLKVTTDRPDGLSEWVDDRIVAVLGSRVRLNPGEQVYLDVCEAIRTGDAGAVRATIREAAKRGLSDLQAPALLMTLDGLRGKAPNYAHNLADVALTEAREAGWEKEPRRTRRHTTIAGPDD